MHTNVSFAEWTTGLLFFKKVLYVLRYSKVYLFMTLNRLVDKNSRWNFLKQNIWVLTKIPLRIINEGPVAEGHVRGHDQ